MKLLNENSYKDYEVNVYTTPRRITTIIDNIIENESIEKKKSRVLLSQLVLMMLATQQRHFKAFKVKGLRCKRYFL
ncbi:hypothetical protein [Fenollaria sporofastidiosus]|uniref:hypothetical protein n=1 Tax=Fenollaria sporofastidiosus TaxID=2811778 RepID=UPI001C008028|nr:hypothetical protein [Fenollaria sporofastidiosus]